MILQQKRGQLVQVMALDLLRELRARKVWFHLVQKMEGGGGGGTASFSRSNASSSFSKSELAMADEKRQKLIKKEKKNRLYERI